MLLNKIRTRDSSEVSAGLITVFLCFFYESYNSGKQCVGVMFKHNVVEKPRQCASASED